MRLWVSVTPLFIFLLCYFYCLDPYFIFNINYTTMFVMFCYSIQVYTCDCSISVTAALEYHESAFHLPGFMSLISYFHYIARLIIMGSVIVITCIVKLTNCD